MRLHLLEGLYTIAKLAPEAPIPGWAQADSFFSITRTDGELSIVCRHVPEDVLCERGWRVLKVRGPLQFSQTGVISAISAPLAEARIPIFVVSTFYTDYVLVAEANLGRAIAALSSAGLEVAGFTCG